MSLTLLAAALATILPKRFYNQALDLASYLSRILCRKSLKVQSAYYRKLFYDSPAAPSRNELDELALQKLRNRIEIRWSQARALGFKTYYPEVEIQGYDHVETAIAQSRGIILWRMSFSNTAAFNYAFWRRKHNIVHLSMHGHLSNAKNWFSYALDSPIHTYDEARFLGRRVVMREGQKTGYFSELKETLQNNGLVSITGDARKGRKREQIHVGSLFFEVPSGAPGLAYSTGAALLPCTVLRVQPEQYKVVIYPELNLNPSIGKAEFRSASIRYYANIRKELMLSHPASEGLF